MPSVDVAMARSLRGGVWGSITGSVASSLSRRDIIGQAMDVKTAFSSWDNCMAVNYCKWPVIAMIIIAGLIIFSIVWCICRCLCCGLSCCCKCCYCLKCCGNCCGMCDPPKGRPHKYLDESYAPNQGYRSQAPMKAPFAPVPAHEPPQYAEFDVSKKGAGQGGEDSLPAMPSWENAGSKKVMLEDEPVELEQLKKPEANGQQSGVTMSGGSTSGQTSPMNQPATSPYGQTQAGSSSGYMAIGAAQSDPYASTGYNQNGAGYGQSQSSLGVDQYGAAGAIAGRRSPQDYNNSTYNQGYNQRSPQGLNSYGQASSQSYGQPGSQSYNQGATSQGYNQSSSQGYAQSGTSGWEDNGTSGYGYGTGQGRSSPPRSNSPAVTGAYSGANRRDDYGLDQPYDQPGSRQDSYSASSGAGYSRAYPPKPQRQYSSDSQRPLASRPGGSDRQYSTDSSPNLQNNGGFDFSSGYSRPQQYNSNRQQQGQNQTQRSAYPGYRAYQP